MVQHRDACILGVGVLTLGGMSLVRPLISKASLTAGISRVDLKQIVRTRSMIGAPLNVGCHVRKQFTDASGSALMHPNSKGTARRGELGLSESVRDRAACSFGVSLVPKGL